MVDVVVEVVVGAGEACAWAGTMTAFTTGFIQWPGRIKAVAIPPIVMTFKNVLRSGLFSLGSMSGSITQHPSSDPIYQGHLEK